MSENQDPGAMEFRKGRDVLDDIAQFGWMSGFGEKKGASPFRSYCDYAFGHRPVGGTRPRFRDHGIRGAILLLKTWKDFGEYVQKAASIDAPTKKAVPR